MTQVALGCFGLLLLVVGGESLIRGASALAKRLSVSPAIVGLTAVAFGTSTPELAVSLFATISDNPGIAFGNVIGSNVANVGLLLGATACFRPLTVHGQIVTREIPMMLLCCAVTLALGMDVILNGDSADRFAGGDGVVLLLVFAVFLYYTVQEVLRQRSKDALLNEANASAGSMGEPRIGLSIVFVLTGIVALTLGGRLLVDAAVELARSLGVPEIVIGSTIIAVGTSLPELVACLVAVRRGMHDMVIGSIIGSNIFNLLCILGVCAMVRPVPVPVGGWVDLTVMTLLALVLLPMAITHRRSITRLEGTVLVVCYAGYAALQMSR